MQKRARRTAIPTILCCLATLSAMTPATAQVCGPLDDGRIADAFYDGTVILWDPLVEYDRLVLTITGPCEDIVREFGPKDQPMFDIREIERIVDGQYSWTLQRVAPIDPGVQKALLEARGSGKENALWWDLFQSGKLPEGPFTEAGAFTVVRGQIIDPTSGVEKGLAAGGFAEKGLAGGVSLGGESQLAGFEKATVLTNADGVIRNSLCVGFDCPNNPSFSDSTILLTENNTRLKFDDTSSVNSFPRIDWEIEANSSLDGGLSYLGFNDCGQSSGGGCATDLVFGVESGARQHALWVEGDGDVGLGTQNPVVRLHVTDGDTPALRLDQDGSSGFAPQVWDVAGNETSFFVRDATNGSTLPFRIFPGSPSNRIVIDGDGQVGIGTTSPSEALHVRSTDGTAKVFVEEASASAATRTLLQLTNNGNAQMQLNNGATTWNFLNNNDFTVTDVGDAVTEFRLTPAGALFIAGSITTGGPTCGGGCDRVFAPDYDLESIEEHAAAMWENSYLPAVGPTPENGAPFNVTEKTGGILNELEKAHIFIDQLNDELKETSGQLAAIRQENDLLKERLGRLERLLAVESRE